MTAALHPLLRAARAAQIGVATLVLLGTATAVGAPAEDSAAPPEPKCGVFFEPRDARVPEEATMQIYLGLAHEMAAGQDCVDSNKIEIACEHFSRVMKALAGASPDISAHVTPSVEARMQKLNCPKG